MTTMRNKFQRAVLLGSALAAGFLIYAATRHAGAQNPAEAMTIAAAGPVALGNGPTEVVLETKDLASRVAALAANRRFYLLLRDPHAEAQPDTLYHVYLGLAQGATPEKGSASDVGALNFYNAVPLEAGSKNKTTFRSFDVTALLKSLQQRNEIGDRITVTIVPSGVPAAGAKASIARIELVEQ